MAFPTFAAWAAMHGKVYNGDEAVTREAIYNQNLDIMQANNEASGGVLGVTQFMDITQEEFKQQYLGFTMPETDVPSLGVHTASDAAAPTSIDWSTKGAVTPVKNQGQCGSCWAFSTTGGLEGRVFTATNQLVSLSEQQFVDCDKGSDQGCNGGLMDNAFVYAASHAICTEGSYSYKGVDGSCQASGCTVGLAQGDVTGHKDVSSSASALESAVAQGPVSVAIEADQSSFQYYTGGVMTGSCGQQLDHGVLAVGYGTDSGTKYWKVKNSWGASWGESGYIRMAQAGNLCGIQNSASYPVISGQVQV